MNYANTTRQQIEAELVKQREILASNEAKVIETRAQFEAALIAPMAAIQKAKSFIGGFEAELARRERMDSQQPTVSDHALLRYMERVYGLDIEACKAAILTENVVSAIKAGATAVKLPEYVLVIRGFTIATVIAPETSGKPKKTRIYANDELDDEVAS
jgi:hypothetical protein